MLMPLDSSPRFLQTANVLCVEPGTEDRDSLHEIFARATWPLCPEVRWQLDVRPSIQPAVSALRSRNVPILMCESRTDAGTWREMLDVLSLLPDPPLLIVTSRLADERLWVEALNLGAYDVLSKPYDRSEVMRVVSMAWMNWQKLHAAPAAAEPRPELLLPPAAPPSRIIRGPISRPR